MPDRLLRGTHGQYLALAGRMLELYRCGAGRVRRELHRGVEAICANESDCPARRIASFARLLDDASEYDDDNGAQASKLRLRVFELSAARHPLVRSADELFGNDELATKAAIATEVGMSWSEIDSLLYADVFDFHRLLKFNGYPDAAALLARYNVAQVQAALYRAESMRLTLQRDFKTVLRYTKLSGLLLDIKRVGASEYRIDVSGPASILRETRRYGLAMARFVPWLLACQGWQMSAILQTPWGRKAVLELSERDKLNGHIPAPSEFDSSVEESFAKKFGQCRSGWTLIREGGILWENQHVFVPDFAFRHEDGTEVFMEIVGFWTPEYLASKKTTLRLFSRRNLLLAIAESLLKPKVELGENIIVYKTALKIEPVIAALERYRLHH